MKFQDLFSEKGLSLERLRTLTEVDEAGSIAASAPDDESRQSLISRQLAQLERFFHTELKRKAGRTIRLTPAGKELAKLAREHLHSLAHFRRACHQQPIEVTLGAGDSLLHWLVLPRLHQIRGLLGNAVVELQDLQNLTICQRLQNHVIDFGLIRSDLVKRGSLAGKALGEFGYSLFVPHGLLPADAKVSEADLIRNLPLAIQGGNTLFQRRLEEIAISQKWRLNIHLLCESFPQAAQILAGGQMAAILPDLAKLTGGFESVRVYPLKSLAELRREIFLAWHPHRLETRPHLAKMTDKFANVLKFAPGSVS